MRIEYVVQQQWFTARDHRGNLYRGHILDSRKDHLTVMLYSWASNEPSDVKELHINSMQNWTIHPTQDEMEIRTRELIDEAQRYPNLTQGHEGWN